MVKEVIIDDNNPFRKKIIYLDKEELGFLIFDLIYDHIEIVDINVLEEYRNKKIGSKLMEYLINYGKDNNCYNITLEVRENNIYAIKLYKKYKFSEVAIREGYYDGMDGVLMELIL